MIENCSEKNYIIIVLIIVLLCLCAMCLLALDYDFSSVSSILCILIIVGLIGSAIYYFKNVYSAATSTSSFNYSIPDLSTLNNNIASAYKNVIEPTAPTRNIPLPTFSSTPPPSLPNTNFTQTAQVGGDKSTDFFNFLQL